MSQGQYQPPRKTASSNTARHIYSESGDVNASRQAKSAGKSKKAPKPHGKLGRFLEKIPLLIGAAVSVVLFVISFQVFSVEIYTNSEILNLLHGTIGFNTGIISADYYPLLPWIFIFLVGSFLGRPFKNGTAPKLFRANPVKDLSFVGRHTLLVYLIHQPIKSTNK